MEHTKLVNYLCELRISQTEFAELVNMHRASINRFCRGTSPVPSNIALIAESLITRKRVNDYLYGIEWQVKKDIEFGIESGRYQPGTQPSMVPEFKNLTDLIGQLKKFGAEKTQCVCETDNRLGL